jgi:hypothetical protein
MSIAPSGQTTFRYPVNIGNQPVATRPWVAGRVDGSTAIISNLGQQSTFTVTRREGWPQGHFIISWSAAHPSGSNYGVIVSTNTNHGATKYHSTTATNFQLTFTIEGGLFQDPFDFTFMTLP